MFETKYRILRRGSKYYIQRKEWSTLWLWVNVTTSTGYGYTSKILYSREDATEYLKNIRHTVKMGREERLAEKNDVEVIEE